MRKLYWLVLGAVLLAASPAWSLTVSVVSMAAGVGNSPDAATRVNANVSTTATLDSGGTVADAVSANQSARVRYAANAWADEVDSWGPDPDIDISLLHSYDVSISVTADAGTEYDIVVETVFAGMLKHIDDEPSGWGVAQAHVGNSFSVTMDQNGGGAVLKPSLAGPSEALGYSYYADSQGFSHTGGASGGSLSGLSGTTTLNFSVSFDSRQRSWTDDVGMLLGLDQPAASPEADDTPEASLYSGTSRTMADDGHFLGITATVTNVNPIPEPASGLLLGLGLMGLVGSGVRRRRA